MPFDVDQTTFGRLALRARRDRVGVAVWLSVLCGMILVMVTLGGATRLTGSGLSIMEWAPLLGTLPPLSEREWHRLYGLYQQIPQYALVNHGFGLEGFKGIFWLEWAHRLWGRLMGVAFAGPLVWFAWRGAIGRPLAWRLAGLLVLGGLQGAVGWFMVASGFDANSTAVSPYRLVVHLALALTLYTAILWTALSLWREIRGAPSAEVPARLPALLGLVCAAVSLTIVAGGFVAGLKAGLTYNTYPLMDGRIVPEGYAALAPYWRNWTENVAAVQFNHRLLATVTATLTLGVAAWGLRRVWSRRGWSRRGSVAVALAALGGAVLAQYALGIATLLWVVPVALGTLHQAMAVLVLTAAIVALHTARASPRTVRG